MRVTIRSLGSRTPPLETPLSAPERLLTPAGELVLLANGSPVHFLAFLTFVPDAVRGNHVHHQRQEWLYIIDGRVEARFYDTLHDTFLETALSGGMLVWMPPGCAHAYRASGPASAIECSTSPYNPTDTIAYLLYPHSGG